MNSIDSKNFEKLCQIGIICKAIYKEQGFVENLIVTKDEVEEAYSSLLGNIDFGENNGEVERI